MKSLISARVVQESHRRGERVLAAAPASVIVTPEARTVAAELGVHLDESAAGAGAAPSPSGALRQAVRRAVLARLGDATVDLTALDALIDEVLARRPPGTAATPPAPVAPSSAPLVAPAEQTHSHYRYQTLAGIKRIDATSLQFGQLAGKAGEGVGVIDVVTAADDSPMTVGYMTWTQCFFPWDLAHDEINVVLEGALHLRAEGEEIICRAGDAVFIPRGSRLEIGTPGHTRFLYVTRPSNGTAGAGS